MHSSGSRRPGDSKARAGLLVGDRVLPLDGDINSLIEHWDTTESPAGRLAASAGEDTGLALADVEVLAPVEPRPGPADRRELPQARHRPRRSPPRTRPGRGGSARQDRRDDGQARRPGHAVLLHRAPDGDRVRHGRPHPARLLQVPRLGAGTGRGDRQDGVPGHPRGSPGLRLRLHHGQRHHHPRVRLPQGHAGDRLGLVPRQERPRLPAHRTAAGARQVLRRPAGRPGHAEAQRQGHAGRVHRRT